MIAIELNCGIYADQIDDKAEIRNLFPLSNLILNTVNIYDLYNQTSRLNRNTNKKQNYLLGM